MRLMDFQVVVGPAGLSHDQQKSINEALFPVYEGVRLWLKEQKLSAPFKKLVVNLEDVRSSEQWHGQSTVVLGICEVTESVSIEAVHQTRRHHEWACSRILDALAHVSATVGWRSEDLESVVKDISLRQVPCLHRFSGLSKQDTNGVCCDVVLEAKVGLSSMKVLFSREGQSIGEQIVASRPGPLFIEDDFPVVASLIEDGKFVLQTKDKKALARVPIPNY